MFERLRQMNLPQHEMLMKARETLGRMQNWPGRRTKIGLGAEYQKDNGEIVGIDALTAVVLTGQGESTSPTYILDTLARAIPDEVAVPINVVEIDQREAEIFRQQYEEPMVLGIDEVEDFQKKKIKEWSGRVAQETMVQFEGYWDYLGSGTWDQKVREWKEQEKEYQAERNARRSRWREVCYANGLWQESEKGGKRWGWRKTLVAAGVAGAALLALVGVAAGSSGETPPPQDVCDRQYYTEQQGKFLPVTCANAHKWGLVAQQATPRPEPTPSPIPTPTRSPFDVTELSPTTQLRDAVGDFFEATLTEEGVTFPAGLVDDPAQQQRLRQYFTEAAFHNQTPLTPGQRLRDSLNFMDLGKVIYSLQENDFSALVLDERRAD